MSRYQLTRAKGPCEACEERLEAAEEKARYWHKRYDEEVGGGPWAQRAFAADRKVAELGGKLCAAREDADTAKATLAAVREALFSTRNKAGLALDVADLTAYGQGGAEAVIELADELLAILRRDGKS